MRAAPRSNDFRDAWAGEIDASRAGTTARVAGWVHRRRDHGGLIFIDLRDRSGIVQLVFHPDTSGSAFAAAEALRPEHVLSASGKVTKRDEQNINPNIPTGEIEIAVADMNVLASARTPPFQIDEDQAVDEMIRLQNRMLDLRREPMRDALILRHEIVMAMREELHKRDFLEIETPILTKSTPEGARDFLVPARMQPGAWYALPQSPQLFKQLLMMSGFERYFQIARCFRDEDLRADRQPEFTQLDVELSFVDEEDVIEMMEAVMTKVFAVAGVEVPPAPWERVPYDEVMLKYGSDRPDRRFGLEIIDIGEALSGSEFKVFESVLSAGGVVRAINAGAAAMSRADLDGLNEVVQRHGGKAVAWAVVEEGGGWRSPIAKFLGDERIAAATQKLGAKPGDTLLFVADQEKIAAPALGGLREELGSRLGLIDENNHDLHWVIDFPMFNYDEAEKRFDALHHPFTAPSGDISEVGGDLDQIRSRAYDLVLDGTEIGGGSIRIHDSETQRQVFQALGMSEDDARERFGFLLDALDYGTPPHGGIAMGLDRIVALCAGKDSIRDVIAFPKTASGSDPLTGAPSELDDKQLRELSVKSLAPPKSE